MRFHPPLVPGRLIRRYKRFLADVELDDGRTVTAHCANPGAMHTCMQRGGRVWLSYHDSPTRKLAHTWELSEVDGALVCVNTSRANDVVAEALAEGVIKELRGYDRVTREVTCGTGSRIDFLLEGPANEPDEPTDNTIHKSCYVEVKSVSLLAKPPRDGSSGEAAFPDAVTTRGTRHARELMDLARAGHRAVLLFVCNRTDAGAIRPADWIDPVYGYTVRRAIGRGVELLAYQNRLSPSGMQLGQRIPVHLPAFDYTPPPRRTRRASTVRIKRGAKKTVAIPDRRGRRGNDRLR